MKYQVKLQRVDEVIEPVEANSLQEAVVKAEKRFGIDGYYIAVGVDGIDIIGRCKTCGKAILFNEDGDGIILGDDWFCNQHEPSDPS